MMAAGVIFGTHKAMELMTFQQHALQQRLRPRVANLPTPEAPEGDPQLLRRQEPGQQRVRLRRQR